MPFKLRPHEVKQNDLIAKTRPKRLRQDQVDRSFKRLPETPTFHFGIWCGRTVDWLADKSPEALMLLAGDPRVRNNPALWTVVRDRIFQNIMREIRAECRELGIEDEVASQAMVELWLAANPDGPGR